MSIPKGDDTVEPVNAFETGKSEELPWDNFEFTPEEHYRLALESILRWTDRSFDSDFQDSLNVRAIAKVAEVALESK